MPEEEPLGEEQEIIVESDAAPEEDAEPTGPPGWMVTFGDAVSLLLTFFVLLLSFSSFGPTDPAKDMVVFNTIIGTGAFPKYSRILDPDVEYDDTELSQLLKQRETEGGFELQEKRIRELLKDDNKKNIELNVRKLEELLEEEKEVGVEAGGEYEVKMSKNKMGFVITFDQGILFNEGKSSLKPSSYDMLKSITALLRQIPNDIIVTAYADDVVAAGDEREKTQYLLSIARANKIAEYLIRIAEIAPERVAATGMGAHTETGVLDTETPASASRATISATGSFDGYMLQLKKKLLTYIEENS